MERCRVTRRVDLREAEQELTKEKKRSVVLWDQREEDEREKVSRIASDKE
jgi:hypothetical protein